MRSSYDFLTGSVYYQEKKKLAEEAERKKKLEAARIEAEKEDQRLEIISTMKPTVANINSSIDALSCQIDQLKELENRICALEISAADRSWRPNQKTGKLRITIRA